MILVLKERVKIFNGVDQQLWEPQQELSKNFRVITFDLWGFGQSASTNGKAITIAEYADEINQLMEQLKIKKAIIGGESMGGILHWHFLKHIQVVNIVLQIILS